MIDLNEYPSVVSAREAADKTRLALARLVEAADQAQDKEGAELRAAAQDAERAKVAERQAIEAARADEFAKLEPEYRRSVEELSRAIQAAADANAEVAQLYGAASQLANGKGIPIPMLHWPELLPETATRATKLSAWRRQVTSYLKTSPDAKKSSRGVRARSVTTLARKLTRRR